MSFIDRSELPAPSHDKDFDFITSDDGMLYFIWIAT